MAKRRLKKGLRQVLLKFIIVKLKTLFVCILMVNFIRCGYIRDLDNGLGKPYFFSNRAKYKSAEVWRNSRD